MDIFKLLVPRRIFFLDSVRNVEEFFSKVMPENGIGSLSQKDIINQTLEREQNGALIVGGMAFPHINIDIIEQPFIALVVLEKGINYFGSFCDIFFVMIDKPGEMHTNLLSMVVDLARNENFVERLRGGKTLEDVLGILDSLKDPKREEVMV